MRALLLKSLRIFDLLLAPLVFLAACLLWGVRRAGVERLRVSRWILRGVGVFPIRNHYYEPLFDFSRLKRPLHEDRALPGIDLNKNAQLELLEKFSYSDELRQLPINPNGEGFFYSNGWFGPFCIRRITAVSSNRGSTARRTWRSSPASSRWFSSSRKLIIDRCPYAHPR